MGDGRKNQGAEESKDDPVTSTVDEVVTGKETGDDENHDGETTEAGPEGGKGESGKPPKGGGGKPTTGKGGGGKDSGGGKGGKPPKDKGGKDEQAPPPAVQQWSPAVEKIRGTLDLVFTDRTDRDAALIAASAVAAVDTWLPLATAQGLDTTDPKKFIAFLGDCVKEWLKYKDQIEALIARKDAAEQLNEELTNRRTRERETRAWSAKLIAEAVASGKLTGKDLQAFLDKVDSMSQVQPLLVEVELEGRGQR